MTPATMPTNTQQQQPPTRNKNNEYHQNTTQRPQTKTTTHDINTGHTPALAPTPSKHQHRQQMSHNDLTSCLAFSKSSSSSAAATVAAAAAAARSFPWAGAAAVASAAELSRAGSAAASSPSIALFQKSRYTPVPTLLHTCRTPSTATRPSRYLRRDVRVCECVFCLPSTGILQDPNLHLRRETSWTSSY